MTRISLIIPAYHESKLLPRLLDTVDVARDRFSGGRDAIEVVVADNASTDSTAAIASARGCRVTPVQKRLIAAARNGGARAAEGEILCFVDADMQIHPETFNAICRALEGDKIVAGSTGGRLAILLATPILLDSAWTLVPTLVCLIWFVIRTVLEDRMLNAELAGYPEYAQRVRYRLIPGVW